MEATQQLVFSSHIKCMVNIDQCAMCVHGTPCVSSVSAEPIVLTGGILSEPHTDNMYVYITSVMGVNESC